MAATIPGFSGCCEDACSTDCSETIDTLISAAIAGHLFNGYSNNAALRAETVYNDGKSADVYGFTTRGDSGLRVFYFDSTSMAVDNGASVLKPDNINVLNPGRWLQTL